MTDKRVGLIELIRDMLASVMNGNERRDSRRTTQAPSRP
jgi:hypothetical protein